MLNIRTTILYFKQQYFLPLIPDIQLVYFPNKLQMIQLPKHISILVSQLSLV